MVPAGFPAVRSSQNPKQNGWDLTYHILDYDFDFFEVPKLACWLEPGRPMEGVWLLER